MKLFQLIFKTFVDALFPLSKEEEILAKMTAQGALEKMPKAPPYDNSVARLNDAHSIFAYQDMVVSRMIWNIKYKKDGHCAEMGAFALKYLLDEKFPNIKLLIIPMPSTLRRKKERGYNQCDFLLEHLKKLDIENRFTVNDQLLIKTRHTSHQKHKDREERLDSSSGLFEVSANVFPSNNSQIILFDDVITTGSTMKAALDTLASAGLSNVSAISLAH